jgi:hypothetical protein
MKNECIFVSLPADQWLTSRRTEQSVPLSKPLKVSATRLRFFWIREARSRWPHLKRGMPWPVRKLCGDARLRALGFPAVADPEQPR